MRKKFSRNYAWRRFSTSIEAPLADHKISPFMPFEFEQPAFILLEKF